MVWLLQGKIKTEEIMENKELYEFVSEVNVVRSNMEKYGGSFTKALANALLHADIQNCRKIKETWGDLWEVYLRWENKGE